MCSIPINTSKIINNKRPHKHLKSYWLPKNTIKLPLVAGTDSNEILT